MTETETPPTSSPGVRVVTRVMPVRIMIANAKGGCGKTTMATNLASYFTRHGEVTALIDYDPQGSSMDWLQARDENLPVINGVAAFQRLAPTTSTKTWSMRVPVSTSRVVIDTPAGLSGNELSDLIQSSDVIIIPVIPSAIDIRAATGFIRDVLLSRAYRISPKPIAVVANRVRKNTLIYAKLERFLKSLQIPFVAAFRDTQFYVRASEHGLGLVDFEQTDAKDMKEWNALIGWVNQHIKALKNNVN
ncbi:AAA family ATPase [Thalassolituus sp. LLYu03]|uniref:nucleotide-binding protein n=1 Tax=Thalassolituus sp. LLYu03 TaxID=3421656 RepID=UPI003D29267F